MKQIYINTMLGTTRIDYDPTIEGDIIIVAPTCTVTDVIQEPIEISGINPADIEWFDTTPTYTRLLWEQERRIALYSDEGPNEKYLRDLIGDDAYENYEIQ